MSLAEAFWKIFEGNDAAHYTWKPGVYSAIGQGITLADVERHLRGELPGLLTIPIMPNGLTHLGCGDVDRHKPDDPPLDHAAIAREITRLGLPLIITRSKSPKSGHIWLFFKEAAGFDAGSARSLIEHYMQKLGIGGDIEVFPKQEILKEGQKGSGINLPYFGNSRIAFGRDGEELSLEGFIELVRERQAFGKILESRDLGGVPSGHRDPKSKGDRPMPVDLIRCAHEKHLQTLRDSNTEGHWDISLNTAAFYAGRAYGAGALVHTEQEIKNEIREAAEARTGSDARIVEDKLTRSWDQGIAQPLKVLDLDAKEAEQRIIEWLCLTAKNPKDDSYTHDEVFTYLAFLSPEAYEAYREQAAEFLHLSRVSKLDDFVAKRRKNVSEAKSQVDFKPSTSWTHAVDGAELLKDAAAAVRRFIVFKNPNDAEVLATWTLGTYLHREYSIFPRLGLTSTFPECGKTTAMDFLDYSCYRAVRGDNVSASVVFRVIDEHHPCLLLDECDTFLQKNPELIGVLNSGHKRGGYVWRTEDVAGKMVSTRFGTYAPVAYAMIGHPVGTLFSRTIFIRLDRKNASQQVEDFDPDENQEQAELMENLRRRMVRWAEDHRAEVKDCKPDTGTLSNRSRNNWRALLKLGQIAGGDWNNILLTAAGCPPPLTKKTKQEKLLRDIRNIFHSRGVDRLPSSLLVADLLAQAQSGWTRYHDGRTELDESDLADLLTDFGVEPEVHHFPKEIQRKLWNTEKDGKLKLRGYLLSQFQGLIATYIPGEPEEVPLDSIQSVPF